VSEWTTLTVLDWTAKRFATAGLATARLEAQVLLAHVLHCTRVQLYTNFDRPLDPAELAGYRDLIKRRLGGEPVAYLVGEQEFWSLPFFVDASVLIPRRDTETLVEVALRFARERRVARIADLCTGSGAVAIALAKECPDAEVIATDVSADALAVARANVAQHAAGRVTLLEGDLTAPLGGTFDVIVSNPPYVTKAEMARLAPDVRREPALALDGGADGLEVIRRLVGQARAFLSPGGLLAIEHGWEQGTAVRALFETAGLGAVATVNDLAGRERVTRGTAPA
jgi:release factor glutamine methyltransferase